MENSFKLEILVPSGKIVSTDVSAVTIPTEMGEVGILPGHASYVTTLGVGLLEYTSVDGRTIKSMVVAGGIAQFAGDTLRILADTVDEKDKVTKGDYDKDRSTLETAISNVDTTTPEWTANKSKLERINAIDALMARNDRSNGLAS
ncbi:MAG: ATP synthase F1 subunit epsilon [bacterium]|nr:ATP synthase F1 subunit epsilon [bacterium]